MKKKTFRLVLFVETVKTNVWSSICKIDRDPSIFYAGMLFKVHTEIGPAVTYTVYVAGNKKRMQRYL